MKREAFLCIGLNPVSYMPPPPQTPSAPAVPEPAPSYVPNNPSIQLEESSISRVMWFGILQLSSIIVAIVLVAVWVGYLITLANGNGIQVVASGIASYPAYFTSSLPILFSIIAIVWAIMISSLLNLWSGLRGLSKIDKASFSTPSKLTLLYLVTSSLGIILTLYDFAIQFSLFQLPNYLTILSNVLVTGLSLLMLALGIIGAVGGMVLGLWRLGTRYAETTLQVGSILTIFIPIVAQILIIIGASSAKNKVRKKDLAS